MAFFGQGEAKTCIKWRICGYGSTMFEVPLLYIQGALNRMVQPTRDRGQKNPGLSRTIFGQDLKYVLQ